ncbi:AAA family ATPase [Streptosporangium saharense]|uniref:nucleotide-binding protein n=1 Tax=Streptosporangium saharense TaxID=1706840 RepID=UPI003333E53E
MARHDREESLEEQLAWLDAIKEQEEAPPIAAKSGPVDDAVISPYPKDPWGSVPAEPDTASSSLFRTVADPSNHLMSSLADTFAAPVEDADAAEWREAGAFGVPPPPPSPSRDDEAFLAPLKPLPRQEDKPARFKDDHETGGGSSGGSSGASASGAPAADSPGGQEAPFSGSPPEQEAPFPGGGSSAGQEAPAGFPDGPVGGSAPGISASQGTATDPGFHVLSTPADPGGSAAPDSPPDASSSDSEGPPESSGGPTAGKGSGPLSAPVAVSGTLADQGSSTDPGFPALPDPSTGPGNAASRKVSSGSETPDPSEEAFEQAHRPLDASQTFPLVGHDVLDEPSPDSRGLEPFTPSARRQDAFPLGSPAVPEGSDQDRFGFGDEPSRSADPSHAGSPHADPSRTDPSHADPSRVDSSRVDEERAVPEERPASTGEVPEGDRSPQATVSDALRQAAGGGALGRSHQSGAFGRDWGRAFTPAFDSVETPPQGTSSFLEDPSLEEPPAEEAASFRDVSFSREALFAQGEPTLRDLSFPQPAAPQEPPAFQETPSRGVPSVPERDPGTPRQDTAEPVREPYQARRRHSAPPPAFSAPSRQPAGSRPSADSLDPDSLLRGRRNAPSGGWRRLVYRASAGLIKPGESPEVRRRRELVTRARTPVATGHHRVAVLSLKGGVGKTTTTVGLGATLAQSRGDRVIAVDANPDRGTLSDKVELETSATVRDLLNERQQIKRYVDVRAFTSQAPSRLEILASDRDPSVSEAFSSSDYQSVAQVLENFYSICITDCGTGLLHSAMSGVLGLADQLVLVSSPSVDGARAASATLDWLEAHHYEELVRSATVVLCSVRPRSKSTVDLDRLEAHFAARCRAVIRVPYDPHLEEGAEIELDRLQPATRDAYLRLAASVGDGFAIPQQP